MVCETSNTFSATDELWWLRLVNAICLLDYSHSESWFPLSSTRVCMLSQSRKSFGQVNDTMICSSHVLMQCVSVHRILMLREYWICGLVGWMPPLNTCHTCNTNWIVPGNFLRTLRLNIVGSPPKRRRRCRKKQQQQTAENVTLTRTRLNFFYRFVKSIGFQSFANAIEFIVAAMARSVSIACHIWIHNEKEMWTVSSFVSTYTYKPNIKAIGAVLCCVIVWLFWSKHRLEQSTIHKHQCKLDNVLFRFLLSVSIHLTSFDERIHCEMMCIERSFAK